MTRLPVRALLLAAALCFAPAARAGTLTTTFAGGNSGDSGWSVLFDLDVLAASGVTVTSLAVNLDNDAPVGTLFTLDVYTRSGTSVGFATNGGAGWEHYVSSGSGTSAAEGTPSLADVADFFLASGVTGVAIRYTGVGPAYTNGALTFGNADLSLTGYASTTNDSGPFTDSLFTPRTWNGTINYDLGTAVVPEPSSLLLLGAGAAGLALRLRRRRAA